MATAEVCATSAESIHRRCARRSVDLTGADPTFEPADPQAPQEVGDAAVSYLDSARLLGEEEITVGIGRTERVVR